MKLKMGHFGARASRTLTNPASWAQPENPPVDFPAGVPSQRRDDCTYSFNPNRVVLRDDNQAKTQSLRGQKRQRVKAQPVHASDDDAASVIHTTEDDSDYDEREIRPSKRSKN